MFRSLIFALIAILGVAATTRASGLIAELSVVSAGLKIEVSDDAPTLVALAGEGIVPVVWERGDRRRATLPLLRQPGAATAIVVEVLGSRRTFDDLAAVPQTRIDPAAYAVRLPERSRRAEGVWLALAATLTLALAALVPRRATWVITAVAVAWSLVLSVAIIRRSPIDRVETAETTWLVARDAGVARVPIRDGASWLPVVESNAHLRSLSPRIVVDERGAMLELTLNRNARVALTGR